MIQKVDDSFPVPVSGKPIQRGWFGALVRFVNSLRLRGDGRYFMVSRNLGGTTIAPSNALIQALDRSGGAAPASGGASGLMAGVSGGTATVSVSVNPGSAKFRGDGTVKITQVRSTATPEEMADWGDRPDGTPKNAGWRGIIPLPNGDVMTEVTIGVEIDGVETDIPLIVPSTTDDDLNIIASLAMGLIDVSEIPQEIEDLAITWAEYRISENLSPYYNGDAEDEQWRTIDSSVIIMGKSGLVATVSGGTYASIIASGENPLVIEAGDNVTITGGMNGEVVIGTTTSGSSGNLVKSQVYMSTGVFMLSPDTMNYYYCPQAYESNGSEYDDYSFGTKKAYSIAAVEAVLGSTISDTTNYSDDYGNTIFILPQNPAPRARVIVNTAPCSGRAVVVTPDARRIVDAYGDPQGVENGLCTDQLKKGYSILYLFVNSISEWPQYVYDDVHSDVEINKATIVSCIQNDGGCWAKIDLKLQPVS